MHSAAWLNNHSAYNYQSVPGFPGRSFFINRVGFSGCVGFQIQRNLVADFLIRIRNIKPAATVRMAAHFFTHLFF